MVALYCQFAVFARGRERSLDGRECSGRVQVKVDDIFSSMVVGGIVIIPRVVEVGLIGRRSSDRNFAFKGDGILRASKSIVR